MKSFLEILKVLGISWDEGFFSQKLDNEAWDFHPYFHEELLRILAPFRRVIILSGDVHYGYTASIDYWDQRADHDLGVTAKFIQCTSSGLKKEDLTTRILGLDTDHAREQALKMIVGTFTGAVKPSPAPLLTFSISSLSIAGFLYSLQKLEHPDVAYCGWENPGYHVKKNGEREYVGPKKGNQGAGYNLPALWAVPRSPEYKFITRPSWRYRIRFIMDTNQRFLPDKESYKGKGVDGLRKQAGDHRKLLTQNSMRRMVGNNNIAFVSFNQSSKTSQAVNPNLFLQQDFWFRLDEPLDSANILNPIVVNARIDQNALDRLALPYTSHKAQSDTAIDPPDEASPQPSLKTY